MTRLNLFNAELSPKRYWQRPISQEMGEWGWRGWRGRGGFLTLLCHHQNDFCMKMGSDDSRFNVSLIVRAKAQSVYEQHLKREESRSGFEPRSFCLPA